MSPALVENLVKENHLISQCFLFGDGKSYCVALLTLNQPELEAFAKSNKIDYQSFSDFSSLPDIRKLIEKTVEQVNSRISSSEQIKKFVILERDFSAESDEITPTLKLKRNVIAERFKEIIESMYVK